MTALLLDSHVLLWWLQQSSSMAEATRQLISAPETRIAVSIASPWELAIKENLGKLRVPSDLAAVLEEERFDLLPINLAHIEVVRSLPRHHGDPLDRIIIAQAQVENLTVVSSDRWFQAYDVALIRA